MAQNVVIQTDKAVGCFQFSDELKAMNKQVMEAVTYINDYAKQTGVQAFMASTEKLSTEAETLIVASQTKLASNYEDLGNELKRLEDRFQGL